MTNTKLPQKIDEALLGYLQGLTLSSGNCFSPDDGVGRNARLQAAQSLLTLFRTTLQEIVPTRFPATEKQTARVEGWDLAIDTINANIKDILGEDKS